MIVQPQVDEPLRIWLGRLLLALALGIGVGLLAYLAARGVAGAVLLGQQRDVLGSISGFSLDAPPATDLRAARKALQTLDAQYQQLSALAGLLVGTGGALVAYLRMERRGE
jgi:hypothetical protein